MKLVTSFFCTVIVVCCSLVEFQRSYANGDEEAVLHAILKLQPAHSKVTAASLAGMMYEAGVEHSIDPLFIVAISFRESSLVSGVVGETGEIGLMQVHGAALLGRPSTCNKTLNTSYCQIHTGARWLVRSKERCPGSPWRWVHMYGSGKCLSEEESREFYSVKRARNIYIQIGGTEWEE